MDESYCIQVVGWSRPNPGSQGGRDLSRYSRFAIANQKVNGHQSVDDHAQDQCQKPSEDRNMVAIWICQRPHSWLHVVPDLEF